MEFQWEKPSSIKAQNPDLLILAVYKGELQKGITLESLNNWLPEENALLFIEHANRQAFEGNLGDTFSSFTFTQKGPRTIALLGLGAKENISEDDFRKAGAFAERMAQKEKAGTIGLLIEKGASIEPLAFARAVYEGSLLSQYQFTAYAQKSRKSRYAKKLILSSVETASLSQDETQKLAAVAKGVNSARDLVNRGPGDLTPVAFAKEAEKLAQETGLEIDILDEKRLQEENMGLLLSVAQGSMPAIPPRLIHLTYKPKGTAKKIVALVGKGVTFDTGGLDIKPAAGMLNMKTDMSGAATVFGTMAAIAKIKPDIEVHGFLACAENSVSATAYHPSDVLTARNGLTVEVINTDAEGRLVLADTIDYAIDKTHPDVLVDVATLTGACVMALGPLTGGLYANDSGLAEDLIKAGQKGGEDLWQLPLNANLKPQLKSSVADLTNCGTKGGGSITAALFLQDFVKNDVKWAHLDIAGPARWSESHPYIPKGGSGFGVQTLTKWLDAL